MVIATSSASAGPSHCGTFIGVQELPDHVLHVGLLAVVGGVHRGAVPDMVLLPLKADEDFLLQDLLRLQEM